MKTIFARAKSKVLSWVSLAGKALLGVVKVEGPRILLAGWWRVQCGTHSIVAAAIAIYATRARARTHAARLCIELICRPPSNRMENIQIVCKYIALTVRCNKPPDEKYERYFDIIALIRPPQRIMVS